MNEANVVIDSVARLTKALQEDHGIKAEYSDVRAVLRDDLHMRYRKINAVSVHANSVRSLVMRQQFALEFMKQWQKGKIIINVDETWVNMSDFRRRKWRPPGDFNSVAKV